MRKILAGALTSLVLIAAAAPSFAHHSTAMFDETKTLNLTGVVKEFQYTNPHSWLIVDVKNDDGTTTTWGFEAEGPSTLMRAGIRKSDLMPGTKVTVMTHPMKDGRPAGQFLHATRGDGKEFDPHKGFAVK
jgi:hypothetical protein